MENLNRLLEISVYTVLLFLIVTAMKKIFGDKMSPTLHFVIWFILIARLCIPFTIDSGVRLIVIPENTISTFQASAGAAGSGQGNSPFIWTDCFFIVWLAGMVLLSIRMLARVTSMNRGIKRHGLQPSSRTQELLDLCRTELGIKKNIKLFLLPNITTPALTVGFRPRIVLPTDIRDCLSEEQLMLAMKHELMHYKRRDHIFVLLLRVLEVVYWFNPVVWLMSRHFGLDMESACDSMVVKNLDNQQRRSYALSLVQLSSQGRMLKFVLGLVFGNNNRIIEKRIRGVFLKSRRKRSVIAAAGAIAVVLLIGCFTTIFQPVIKNQIADESPTVTAVYITETEKEPASAKDPDDLNDNSQIYFYTVDCSVRDATGSVIKQAVRCYSVITTTGSGEIKSIASTGDLGTEFLTTADTTSSGVTITSDMAAQIEASLRDAKITNKK